MGGGRKSNACVWNGLADKETLLGRRCVGIGAGACIAMTNAAARTGRLEADVCSRE